MELFDKKFVYLEWDDALKGKKVVIGDTLGELKRDLHSELFVSVMENKGDYPFTPSENDMNFAMAYYDPNYSCKKAHAQGKVIQCRNKGDDRWIVTSHPNWLDMCEYRVMPEKKCRPFRNIAELKQTWLAKNGAKSKGDLYEPFIWIRDKERPDITRFITGFNGGIQCVALAGQWCTLEALFDEYEFLDGTPCGVEE